MGRIMLFCLPSFLMSKYRSMIDFNCCSWIYSVWLSEGGCNLKQIVRYQLCIKEFEVRI